MPTESSTTSASTRLRLLHSEDPVETYTELPKSVVRPEENTSAGSSAATR